MATKPLTTEAIALTEKKMAMSLDDIIKLSKANNGNPKKQQRVLNTSRKTTNGKQDRSVKVQQYMDSRSTLRQGVLAQRRSSFQGNTFPVAPDAARKSVSAPVRNGGFNRNKPVIWNRQRATGTQRRHVNGLAGGKPFQQQQQQHKQQPQRGEIMPNQKPKTLDSLFANMKEQRMKAFTRTNNGGAVRGAVNNNHPRQPWLRGRFGNYRN